MRMEKELAGEDERHFNLKKGKGGLVDIEFLTQMLQLSHGNRVRQLRRRDTLSALQELHSSGILKEREYRVLHGGYLFLRRLDHRLRLQRDQSIEGFEAEPLKLTEVARALGYSGSGARQSGRSAGEKLLRDYAATRNRIRACYDRHFKPELRSGQPDATD
jgi:glutamate-ammonia-ligase adenylyltransferase